MISNILFGLGLFGSLYLGVLVYRNNPKGRDNRSYIKLIFWLIMWLIATYTENEPMPAETRSFFLYADFILAPILGYYWFQFNYTFLEEDRKLNQHQQIALLISVVVSIIVIITGLGITDVDASGRIIQFSFGPLFFIYAISIIFYFVGGSVAIYFKYRRLTGQKRIQALYVLYGFLITSIIGTTVSLFFQDNLPVSLFRISTFSSFVFVGFTYYAIAKHHLFDIRSIVQRGIIYSGLFAIIISFYLVSISIVEFIFQQSSDVASALATFITITAGIFGVPYLERIFRRLTDRIFYKDKYIYSEAIYNLSEIINRNLNLETLLDKLSNELQNLLKVKSVTFTFPQKHLTFDNGKFRTPRMELPPELIHVIEHIKEKVLIHSEISDKIKNAQTEDTSKKIIKVYKLAEQVSKEYGFAASVAIDSGEKLVGIILIGEKKSGDIFTRDDVNLLKTISHQAAVAIEKAQLFEQVKEYSEELEHKVEERTSKIRGLQEEQKQMMEEVSHGLQTPLTILRGEINQLKEEVKDTKKLTSLERSIDRVSKFIYDMLRLSSLGSSEVELKQEEINLSGLLTDLIESYQIITSEQNIKIRNEIKPSIKFFGDEQKIEEVINNLVSNSVKYARDDEKQWIKLSLKKIKNQIELIVEDNGTGIAKEHIPHLFTRFHRVEDEAHAHRRGTGLGLAICKEIIEKHKGNIKVESQANKGTKFIINLPIAT